MSETPLQAATRWKKFWHGGMSSYGHLCADSLVDDDLEDAQKYALRYARCRDRFFEAVAREAVAQRQESPASAVDWGRTFSKSPFAEEP